MAHERHSEGGERAPATAPKVSTAVQPSRSPAGPLTLHTVGAVAAGGLGPREECESSGEQGRQAATRVGEQARQAGQVVGDGKAWQTAVCQQVANQAASASRLAEDDHLQAVSRTKVETDIDAVCGSDHQMHHTIHSNKQASVEVRPDRQSRAAPAHLVAIDGAVHQLLGRAHGFGCQPRGSQSHSLQVTGSRKQAAWRTTQASRRRQQTAAAARRAVSAPAAQPQQHSSARDTHSMDQATNQQTGDRRATTDHSPGQHTPGSFLPGGERVRGDAGDLHSERAAQRCPQVAGARQLRATLQASSNSAGVVGRPCPPACHRCPCQLSPPAIPT